MVGLLAENIELRGMLAQWENQVKQDGCPFYPFLSQRPARPVDL